MEELPGGGLHSEVLGTDLRLVDGWVRVVDPKTGGLVPTPAEQTAARREAEERAAPAGAELRALRAELEGLRGTSRA